MTTVPASRPQLWIGTTLASARANAQTAAQYRANLLFWGFVGLLQNVIYIAVWQAVARAQGGSVGGYSTSEFAAYFITGLIVRELTFTWIQGQLPKDIRLGELSAKLLRPVHPLFMFFGAMAATNLQFVIVLAPLLAVCWFAFDAQLSTGIDTVALMIIVLPLAAMARFMCDALVGCVAFWFVRIDAIRSLYTVATLLLAGQFAPLDVLPEWMRSVAQVLPFYWALGFPIELLMGRLSAFETMRGILILALWAAGLWLILQVVWRAGMRRYGAVGA